MSDQSIESEENYCCWRCGTIEKQLALAFSLPITPWPCLNILIHRVKQQCSHLSFNAHCLPCRWIVWNAQFLKLTTTPHLCCNRQFPVKAWNKAAWASTIYTNCSSRSVSFSDINYSTECLHDICIQMSRSILYHSASTWKPQWRSVTANVENLWHVWPAADGCYTYGCPYGVWAETQQWGEPGHNTQLSGQIGEQLLRAICLTSPIVVASEKGNATALPTDSYRGLRLHGGAGGLCPCLTLTGSQMLALRLGEGLAAGDVAQRCPECWTVCSLSAKGYPLLVPRAGGGSWACTLQ